MAAAGKKDEALKIAVKNANLLPASYNLAAIFAQTGQRDKALDTSSVTFIRTNDTTRFVRRR
jgi:hypothetical protein